MSDLAAAARILGALAEAIDRSDEWVPALHVTVGELAAHFASHRAAGAVAPDDRAIAAALLDAARRELAVPEVQCPACSATIRARLMDQPGVLTDDPAAAADPDHCGDPAPALVGRLSTGWCIRRPGHGVPHRDRDGAEWTRRETPRTLTEAELPRVYELCAQVCESESATVAGHFLGQLRDLLGQPRPRVWLRGDTVPAGACFVPADGFVAQDTSDDAEPWVTDEPLVEVFVPDFAAAVAAEQARRAETDSDGKSSPESRCKPTDDAEGYTDVIPAPAPVSDELRARESPAERLRRAADLVEQRAAAASGPRWKPEYGYGCTTVQAVFVECDGDDCGHDALGHVDSTCAIGAMHTDGDNQWAVLAGPQLAPPLAVLLRDAADGLDRYLSPLAAHAWHRELALADQILGEADR